MSNDETFTAGDYIGAILAAVGPRFAKTFADNPCSDALIDHQIDRPLRVFVDARRRLGEAHRLAKIELAGPQVAARFGERSLDVEDRSIAGDAAALE